MIVSFISVASHGDSYNDLYIKVPMYSLLISSLHICTTTVLFS